MSKESTNKELMQKIEQLEKENSIFKEKLNERADEALAEKDTMLKNIASQVPGMLYQFMMSPDGSYSVPYSSEGVKDIFGCSPEEVRNDFSPIFNVIKDKEKILQTIGESVNSMSRWKCEYRVQIPGKPVKWVFGNSIPEKKPDGSIIWSGYNLDITERKKFEKDLIEVNEKYRALFQQSSQGIFLHDLEGNIIDVNEMASLQTGFSKEELLELSVFDLHPDTGNTINLPKNEILRLWKQWDTFKRNSIEGEHQKKDGTVIPVQITTGPILVNNKKLLLAVVEDISEHKKDEEERKRLQAQLSNALEIARLGPWEYDVATDSFTFNDYFYKIFRTTAEEVGGYKMKPEEYANRFLHPDDIHRVRKETQKAIETEDPEYRTRLEHRIIYSDGTVGHVSVQIFIVKDDKGNTIKNYGVNQDITELKNLEEEVLRSQKMESIGTLAGGIAHDFNNILTAILGNVTMSRDQTDPNSEIYELLSEAETASKRAQKLTKQLLTFAKGGTPVKETADIKDLIKESSLFVTRGSKSKCEFSISNDLLPADVDTGQISQVINNIVINADQSMPEGGIIHIGAENQVIDKNNEWKLDPGRYIKISVKDEGIGIPGKYLSKIFDPYFSTKQAGSGLGLATSYSIVKNHNGLITAESLIGKGTKFHLFLPASEKQVPQTEDDNKIRGEGRILVMDDEEALRKVLKRMLQKLGYEADFAKDGFEALEIYKSAKEAGISYDVVILDLTIPGGMGGKDTIERLKEIDPQVKAIVSSGYSDDPVLASYQEYGFKGIMPKPFESSALSKVLDKVLT